MGLDRYTAQGRIGRMEMKYLASGTPVMNVSIAVDRSYKDRDGNKVERTFWANVKAFGKQAEFIDRWCRVGARVILEAQPQTRSWEDKDGKTQKTTEFHVGAPGTGITPIDWPEREEGQGQTQGRQSSGNQNRGRSQGNQNSGRSRAPQDEDLGPAFPSEASGMDDVPF